MFLTVFEETVSGKSYKMAAEVGLLTRNIKIVGADYSNLQKESFGARVIVGQLVTPRSSYIGKTIWPFCNLLC